MTVAIHISGDGDMLTTINYCLNGTVITSGQGDRGIEGHGDSQANGSRELRVQDISAGTRINVSTSPPCRERKLLLLLLLSVQIIIL